MRARLVLALAAALLVAGCTAEKENPDGPERVASQLTACPEQTGEPAQGGERLPDLAFDCPGGGTFDLGQRPGVPTVLNLWGSWCPPCREELPVLQDLADVAGEEVQVVGLISKDGLPQAESFATDTGLAFAQAFDGEGELMTELGLNQLPYTYFVDADGALAYTQVGPVHSLDELRGLVSEHLGVQL